MADHHYTPPEQSKAMQLVDIIFLIAAIFVALWLPLKLELAGAAKGDPVKIEAPTWEALGQNPVQAAQWEKLGKTPADAHDIIQSRYNYDINWVTLIGMTLALLAYFLFLFWMSDREYREVLAEKFDERKR